MVLPQMYLGHFKIKFRHISKRKTCRASFKFLYTHALPRCRSLFLRLSPVHSSSIHSSYQLMSTITAGNSGGISTLINVVDGVKSLYINAILTNRVCSAALNPLPLNVVLSL